MPSTGNREPESTVCCPELTAWEGQWSVQEVGGEPQRERLGGRGYTMRLKDWQWGATWRAGAGGRGSAG